MMITIKVTHPIITEARIIQAGEIVTVPVDKGSAWIEAGWAYEYIDELPVKRKAVKHDDR